MRSERERLEFLIAFYRRAIPGAIRNRELPNWCQATFATVISTSHDCAISWISK